MALYESGESNGSISLKELFNVCLYFALSQKINNFSLQSVRNAPRTASYATF